MDVSAVVKPGTLLKCDTLSAQTIHRNSMPETFAWAEKNNLIEEHNMTGTNQFSDKITTTRSFNRRTLCVGCWVADEVFKETIKGRDYYYAVGIYRINNLILDSPILKSKVCKNTKQEEVFEEKAYTIFYEYLPKVECSGEMIESLEKMEGRKAVFRLKHSSTQNGFIVNIDH